MTSEQPPGASNVCMKDIAQLAGVSLMTVSRALKDNPRQSKATRERIQNIARELGYKPHPYVSALMSNVARTRPARATANLAVLHFDATKDTPRHPYYDGILSRARELGYAAEAFLYNPTAVPSASLRKVFIARGIAGIILLPAATGFASVDFDFDGFAVAAMGHTIVDPPMPRVASDIYGGIFLALDEVRHRGYGRIGLVNTKYINSLGNYLYSAAIAAYRGHVAPHIHLVEWIVQEPLMDPKSLRAMRNWILREKLDAILAPTFGFPLYEILLEQGFKIPDKLGYLHLLNSPYPDVTCLDQMGEFMGTKAVDIVVAAITRNDFKRSEIPYMLATMPTWQEGKTLPHKAGFPRR